MDGAAANILALTDDTAALASGVEHGDVLIAFAEAIVGDDDTALAQRRQDAIRAMGAAAMVDAAGVAANFERMVRIADATGIPLDDRMEKMTQTVRAELHLERFAGSKNMAQVG